MPALGADPMFAVAKRKVVEHDQMLNIPGDSVVTADHGIATASIAGQLTALEIDPADDGHHQIAVGHTDQVGVVSARFKHDLHRGPGFPVVLGYGNRRSLQAVFVVRVLGKPYRNKSAQGCYQVAIGCPHQ